MKRSKIFAIIILVGFLGVLTINSNLVIFEITSQAFIPNNSLNQYSILWNNTFGGDFSEIPGSIIQNDEGEYLVVGSIYPPPSKVTMEVDSFVLIIKIDAKGNILWDKTYERESIYNEYRGVQTSDGGYVIAGIIRSPFLASLDVLILKIDKNGNLLWSTTYNRGIEHELRSLIPTDDGGFAVLCFSSGSMWLVKADDSGVIQWNRTYGKELEAGFYDIIQTDDGGFVLAGSKPFRTNIDHMWVVKINTTGGILWDRGYGGLIEGKGISPADVAFSIIKTNDGGFALAGAISSYGDQSGDMWLMKTNAAGDIEWNQTYGTEHIDYAKKGVQTTDGGYALAGVTITSDVYIPEIGPTYEQCLIKTSVIGEPEWNLTFSSQGSIRDMIQTTEGDLVLMGGGKDIWFMRFDLPPFAERSDSILGLDVFSNNFLVISIVLAPFALGGGFRLAILYERFKTTRGK